MPGTPGCGLHEAGGSQDVGPRLRSSDEVGMRSISRLNRQSVELDLSGSVLSIQPDLDQQTVAAGRYTTYGASGRKQRNCWVVTLDFGITEAILSE